MFNPPTGPAPSGEAGDRPTVKRYRVDFIRQIVMTRPAETTETPTETPTEIETPVTPEPPVETPPETPTEAPVEATTENPPANGGQENTDIKPVEEPYTGPVTEFHDVDEQPGYYFPDLDFNDAYGNPVDNGYIHNPNRYEGTVIYIVDISEPGGYQTLTDWAELWGSMLKISGVVEPPNLISFSVALKDPYSPQARYLKDNLKRKIEREKLLDVERPDGTIVRHTHVPDPEGRILDKLGIAEMDTPIVFLLDGNGGVMVKLEGRLRDMGSRDVDATISKVQKLWGMSDREVWLAKQALNLHLAKLRGGG